MDLKSGFYQVKLDEDSIKYASFVVPNGQFEFLRPPFGLKNCPAIFQRFVAGIFKDFLERNEIVIYVDDIVVTSKTVEEHIVILGKIWDRLASYRLKIKRSVSLPLKKYNVWGVRCQRTALRLHQDTWSQQETTPSRKS